MRSSMAGGILIMVGLRFTRGIASVGLTPAPEMKASACRSGAAGVLRKGFLAIAISYLSDIGYIYKRNRQELHKLAHFIAGLVVVVVFKNR
jgi:hypothetical protein